MTSSGESQQSSKSGNKWTMLMDELRYKQERQRSPYVMRSTEQLNNPTFAGPDGQMFSTPEEASGMTRLKGLTDFSDMMMENRRAFEQDGIPMITNKMSAAGYGRTPNVGNAIAQGWMSSIMPTLQESRQAARDYSGLEMGFGARRLGQAGAVTPITSSSSSMGSSSQGGFLRSFW